jgi:hypothetical protein
VRVRDVARNVRRPRLLAHHVRQWLYEARHPGRPWLAPGSIQVLERELRPDMAAFEWGSGRSTAWLGARVGSLTSIEHHEGWHATVTGRIVDAGLTAVECRLVPVPDDEAATYWDDTAYVAAIDAFGDESLDLVVVDGVYRQHCAWRALAKVRPGGLLLVDDTRHLATVEDWRIPWERIYGPDRGIWSTVIWRRPA